MGGEREQPPREDEEDHPLPKQLPPLEKSSTKSGYKNVLVVKRRGRVGYVARVPVKRSNGTFTSRSLGTFVTATAAARCYQAHMLRRGLSTKRGFSRGAASLATLDLPMCVGCCRCVWAVVVVV